MAMDEENELSIRHTIKRKHTDLGPMRFHEGAVLTLFTILIALWFFREPRFMSGWAGFLSHGRYLSYGSTPHPRFGYSDLSSQEVPSIPETSENYILRLPFPVAA